MGCEEEGFQAFLQFSSAKLKMAVAVVKVIWVSPDDKPGESEVGASSNIKQLLDKVEHDIMNYQNRGLCYLPKPKAEADNTDTRFR